VSKESTKPDWPDKIAELATTAPRNITMDVDLDETVADVVSALDSEKGAESLRAAKEGTKHYA